MHVVADNPPRQVATSSGCLRLLPTGTGAGSRHSAQSQLRPKVLLTALPDALSS